MNMSFLGGNYAPVSVERTITDLPVTGTIPAHLDGRYLRIGPNPIAEVDPAAYHLFTGDGMVHGVRIRDGRAQWYRNRWVRSPSVAAALGEPARPAKRTRTWDAVGANTNVIGHAGRTYALIESGFTNYELTAKLDTAGPCDFDGTIPGGYTAHPKRDPDTGELHAVSYFFGWGNKVSYTVLDTAGRARRSVDIEVTGSPMMHDFSLTEKHVVLYDLPVTFDGRRAGQLAPRFVRGAVGLVLSALVGRVRVPDPITAAIGREARANSSEVPYSWNPRYPARIGVMPRDGGNADVRWFEIEPCYLFHPLNAYDEGNTVVLDVVRYPKMFDRSDPGAVSATLDRWTVDLTTGKVTEARHDDHPQEWPRIDERRLGKRHRFGYSIAYDAETPDVLLKHDLVRGTTTTYDFGPSSQAGEFVFAPNSPDAAEDDGVLMGFVYHRDTGSSDLAFLDAGTLEPIAKVHLPDRVPHGFHGNWVPTGN